MRRGASFVFAAALSVPVAATAGPWAREPGEIFLSYSVSASSDRAALNAAFAGGTLDTESYHSIYGEIGLGRRLTFGADIGRGDGSSLDQLFLRYTLSAPNDAIQFAVDGGVARRDTGAGDPRMMVRAGVAIGRGFGPEATEWVPLFRPEGGWMSLDASVLIDPETEDTIWQAEATLGVNLSDRFAGMFQLKAEEYPGDDMIVTASPSVLWRFAGETSLQVGGRFGLSNSDEIGLRIGLWREF
ncbi:hypothetical protein HKCCE2091_12210 [Rhodobacterales bacterium HKCCE2091]|nr:hypothetical protein [Rhodobacterales bacterium HKCCE2091]